MKKLLITFLSVLVYTCSAYATHVIGSDWQYKCLNTNGDYEITLILYRDCSGLALCSSTCGAACSTHVSIQGASPGCNNNNYGIVTLNLVSVRDVNLNPRCGNAKSICNNIGCVTPGSFSPGVERYEFRGTVNLGASSGIPAACCNVRFSYSLCCRSNSISTGAASSNYYTEMNINRCLSTPYVNSSPILTNDVPHILCTNQPAIINCGAVDPDMDSLYFSFVPSLAGSGSSVPYTPPYAYERPLPWSGPSSGTFPNGIRCNPVNGDVSFTPAGPNNFVGIMAIGIQQWRKNTTTGVMEWMGTTRRDMMVWLRSCDINNPPFITTEPALIPGTSTPRTTWLFYAGRENCFELTANDSNITDTTYLSWNGALASRGARFLPTYNPSQRRFNGPRQDRYRFCWTPADSNIGDQPYLFTVKAEDDRCPLNGSSERAIQIYVKTPPSVGATGRQNPVCNQYNFTANINPGSGWFNHIDWTVTQTPNDRNFEGPVNTYRNNGFLGGVQFGIAGRYYIKQDATIFYHGNLNNHITIIDSIDIAQNGFAFNVRDTFFCATQPIVLRPQIFNPAGDTLTYVWTNTADPSIALSLSDTLQVHYDTNNRTYVLLMDNGKDCILRDTFIVRTMPLAKSPQIWGPTEVQLDKPYEYQVTNTPGASYIWSVQNGSILQGQGSHKITLAWNSVGGGRVICNEIIDGCKHDTLQLISNITLPTTLVNEAVQNSNVSIFPNPANGVLYLKTGNITPTTITLMDMSGKAIEVSFKQEQADTWSIDIHEFADGLYTAMVNTAIGDWKSVRFIKSSSQVR
jgi:hypothetical protein